MYGVTLPLRAHLWRFTRMPTWKTLSLTLIMTMARRRSFPDDVNRLLRRNKRNQAASVRNAHRDGPHLHNGHPPQLYGYNVEVGSRGCMMIGPDERLRVCAENMGLSISVLKAIKRKGFQLPTPIQRKTIPLILQGVDVVGMAMTGSGKTGAFVIPIVHKYVCRAGFPCHPSACIFWPLLIHMSQLC